MSDRIYGDLNNGNPPANTGVPRRNSNAGNFGYSANSNNAGRTGVPPRDGVPTPNNANSAERFRVTLPESENNYSANARPARPAAQPTQGVRRTTSQPSARGVAPRGNNVRPSNANYEQRRAEYAARRNASNAAQRKPLSEKEKAAMESQRAKAEKQAQKKASKKSRKALTPEQAAKRKIEKRYGRTKSLLIVFSSLIIIAVITTTLTTIAFSTIDDILAINKSNSSTVSVYIPEKATFDDVFNALCDNGLIKQKRLSRLFCEFRHYDEAYSYSKKKVVPVSYEAGVYYFETGDGLESMLEAMKSNSGTEKETVRLTFPEGWTIAQVFAKIEKYEVCTAEKLYTNLDIIGKQFDFYNDIKSKSGRYLKAEGYIFPDTYDFYIGESASSVLKKLFTNFETKWTKEYAQKAKNLGYSKDQILTIASIIQREAKDSSQMGDISSVIYNRLKDSATYPQLEMNSTKDYITTTKTYDVFTDFDYTLYLESYNTYSAKGLPPGPICNPGTDAIEAALNPNDTSYYFFCHDSNGNIYLAQTQREHQINTEKILYETD